MKAGDEISGNQVKVGMVIRAVSNYSRTVIEGEVSEVPDSSFYSQIMLDDNFGIDADDYTITVVEIGAEEQELVNTVVDMIRAGAADEDTAYRVIAQVRRADAA